MKPLKLTMTAFGPYKDQEVIDFTQLEEHQLFVISGNTGSGKTTIFDGISFALYGEASGQDRDRSLMMRSDFADDNVHTSVELLFSINGHTYRILRQLGHVKQGNKSKTGERYEFFERLESGDEIPCVDRQMVSDINQKVESMIGLTQDQFKQIVMLPQGEFRKLLTSKTENKEAILRRLFKTDAYKQISDRLREKKDEAAEAFNRKKQTYDHYVGNIEAVLPRREASELFNVHSGDYTNANQILSGLDGELLFYQSKIEEDEKQYLKAYQAHSEKQAQWHQAKAMNESIEELEQKQARLAVMNKQQSEYDAKEKHLETAERARRIEPYEKQLQTNQEIEETKQKQLAEADKAYTNSKETLRQKEQQYEAEQKKQSDREAARRDLDKLKEYVPAVEAFNDIEKKLASLHKTKEEKEKQLQASQTNEKTTNDQLTQKKQALNALESVPSELSKQTIQMEKMREKARVIGEFLTARQHVETKKTDLRSKEEAWKQAKLTFDNIEAEWLSSHAEWLASHLQSGQPCPVCGSTSHPQKADNTAKTVTKQDYESAKQAFDKQDQLYRNAKANLNSAESELETKSEAVSEYVKDLNQAQKVYDDLVPAGQKLKTHIQSLEKQNEERESLRKEIEKLEEQANNLNKQTKEADQALQKAIGDINKEQAVYDERMKSIPEYYRNLDTLKQAITQAEKHKQHLETAWDQAQTQLQEAKQKAAQTETSLEHAKKQVQEAINNRQNAQEQFQEQLKQAEFTDEQTYQSSKMDDQSIEQLKETIHTFKQQRLSLMEQTTELSEKLKGQTKQDIDALNREKEELKSAYETALKTWKQSEDYYKEAKKLRENIEQASHQVKHAEERLAQLTHLDHVIRGQNNQKVSFERYLQIEYLEQIIEAANERLKHLSNGQFYLIRSDRQEAHGRQSGLGLDIYDAYTGQNRDVKTLSGGEKFNASLCLALGMSDIIQSFQGGVSINMMFIDEGFGTLDEEALHKAIDTLIDLQQTGRMIGVISHVQELKDIFPAVLEVIKTKEGSSHTRMQVR